MSSVAIPAPIGTYMIEHTDGRPVAYVDATGLTVFTYQQPDGTYVVEVFTRDNTAAHGLRLSLDGCLMDTGGVPRPQREPPW
jgi:hypothetical protein